MLQPYPGLFYHRHYAKTSTLVLDMQSSSLRCDGSRWSGELVEDANVSEAIFVARRFIDKAFADKDGQLVLLALDWAKAFDTIKPDSLMIALHRFGIRGHIYQVI